MLHLVVVVCMAPNTCETVRVPLTYPTEERCATQAAIVAGMVRGRSRPSRSFSYQYTCSAEPKGQVAER